MDSLPIEACERGLVPDFMARAGMRRLIGQRLATPEAKNADKRHEAMRVFLERANSGPIAQHTADANAQHYELPPAFFEQVLGAHLKYSGCLFEPGIDNLDTAEHAMLALTPTGRGFATVFGFSISAAAGARSRYGPPSVSRTR